MYDPVNYGLYRAKQLGAIPARKIGKNSHHRINLVYGEQAMSNASQNCTKAVWLTIALGPVTARRKKEKKRQRF